MSTTNKILEILESKGYKAEEAVIKKNGAEFNTIQVQTSDEKVKANFYLNDDMSDDDIDAFIKKVEDEMSSDAVPRISDMIKDVKNYESIKHHLHKTVLNMKNAEDSIVMKEFAGDIGIAFYLDLGDGMVKVSNGLLDIWGVDVETLLQDAIVEDCDVKSMFEVMAELDPMLADAGLFDGGPKMFVVSNASKHYGAGAILEQSTIDEIRKKLGDEFYIIPSSVHELIALEYDSDIDPEGLAGMIGEVNATEVRPEDFLSDIPYVYKHNDGGFQPA